MGFCPHIDGISVLLLRYHFSETEAMKRVLTDLFKGRGDDLWGKFVTVSIRKIRVRPL